MATPLATYMEQKNIGDAEFAALIGKDRSLVNRLRRGDVRPTLEVAARIEDVTDGDVPMQAWVEQTSTEPPSTAKDSTPTGVEDVVFPMGKADTGPASSEQAA